MWNILRIFNTYRKMKYPTSSYFSVSCILIQGTKIYFAYIGCVDFVWISQCMLLVFRCGHSLTFLGSLIIGQPFNPPPGGSHHTPGGSTLTRDQPPGGASQHAAFWGHRDLLFSSTDDTEEGAHIPHVQEDEISKEKLAKVKRPAAKPKENTPGLVCAVCGDSKLVPARLWYNVPACQSCMRFYMRRVVQQVRDKVAFVCDNNGKWENYFNVNSTVSAFCRTKLLKSIKVEYHAN